MTIDGRLAEAITPLHTPTCRFPYYRNVKMKSKMWAQIHFDKQFKDVLIYTNRYRSPTYPNLRSPPPQKLLAAYAGPDHQEGEVPMWKAPSLLPRSPPPTQWGVPRKTSS